MFWTVVDVVGDLCLLSVLYDSCKGLYLLHYSDEARFEAYIANLRQRRNNFKGVNTND